MTTQPTSSPGTSDAKTARQFTDPLRQTVALILLIVNGVFLFIGISQLLFVDSGWSERFDERSAAYHDSFVGTWQILLPIIAVLLATHVLPAVPKAKTLTLIALIEYLVSAVFGAIMFIAVLVLVIDADAGLEGVESLFGFAAKLTLVAIALLVVLKIWTGMYTTPKAPAGYYGGYPQGYGQQYPQGYGQGQPQQYQPGYAQPGYPPQQQQQAGYPTQAYPASGGGWPSVPPPPAPNPPGYGTPGAPQSAPPASPQSGPPQTGMPQSGPPHTGHQGPESPTQRIG